jgi:hypothetical protein
MAGLCDAAEPVVTELMANAIRHVPDRRCTVLLLRRDDGAGIEVRDSSRVLPALLTAGPGEECGRGPALVAAAAHNWGAKPLAEGGKAGVEMKNA